MKNLLLLLVASIGLVAGPTRADASQSIHDALSGTWVAWDANDTTAKSGLTSITFRLQGIDGSERNMVSWETMVDGKRSVRSGTFTLEESSNLFFPDRTTWCVKIRDISPDYSADAVVHLVNVIVSSDNRFPSTEVVLKGRDAFYTEFLFRRAAKIPQAPTR